MKIFVCIALVVVCAAGASPASAVDRPAPGLEGVSRPDASVAVLVGADGSTVATRPLPQHHASGTAVHWTCRYYGVTAVTGDLLPAASTEPAPKLVPGSRYWLDCFDDDEFGLADQEFLVYDPTNPLGPVGAA